MRQRNITFDFIKGVAILLVVLGHVCQKLEPNGGYRLVLIDIIYSFHMPLFVFVSGFFTSKTLDRINSLRGGGKYLYSKVIRLLLPLLFIPVLYILINHLSPRLILTGAHWFTYALFNLLLVQFIVLLIIRAIYKIFPTLKRFEVVLLVISVMLLDLLITYAYSVDARISNGLLLYKLRELYPCLLFGYILGKNEQWNSFLTNSSLVAVSFFLYVSLFAVDALGLSNISMTVMSFPAILFIYGTSCSQPNSNGLRSKFYVLLSDLGRISLPIYFVHSFFLPNLEFLHKSVELLKSDVIGSLAYQVSVGLLGSICVLIPTILIVWVTRSNLYLRFFLYGEPLPSKRTSL